MREAVDEEEAPPYGWNTSRAKRLVAGHVQPGGNQLESIEDEVEALLWKQPETD